MQTTGIITDIGIDYKTRKSKISLLLDSKDIEVVEELKNENKLTVEIKKWRKKRSLDSNAYCWVLCDLIAKKLTVPDAVTTKEMVYRDAILHIGTYESMIIEEKALEKWKRIWNNQGIGFLVEEVSRKDKCVRINCYYGSSTYDSKEMWLLIQLLIDEAKKQGIETRPEEEIKNMMEEWDISVSKRFKQ